jgi:hypothetical protein
LGRLNQLKAESWKPFIDAGSIIVEHDNTTDSAVLIIQTLLKRSTVLLEAQREMVDERLKFSETEAGKIAYAEHDPQSSRLASWWRWTR